MSEHHKDQSNCGLADQVDGVFGSGLGHQIEDPMGFAHSASVSSGQIPISQLVRLSDRLVEQAGAVTYVLKGGCDSRARPFLNLQVVGDLILRCDFCLAVMSYPLIVDSQLMLSQGAVPEDLDDPDAPDWIEVESVLAVNDLVEDEIVLSLPLSVRHKAGLCSERPEAVVAERDHPMAALSKWLKQ